jgi:hypothetical protein
MYAGGEAVRKCELDLAPEAPWRCPDDCGRYEHRRYDSDLDHGTLVRGRVEDEPEGEGIAELLDAAEDVVNAAGPSILAELEAEQARQGGRLRRLFRRNR